MRQLRHHGFERLTIVTGHLAELIEAFFGDGEQYGIAIDYFREDEPLGTVGALALLDGLDEDFLVMNGDVLTDLDYAPAAATTPSAAPPPRSPPTAARSRSRSACSSSTTTRTRTG